MDDQCVIKKCIKTQLCNQWSDCLTNYCRNWQNNGSGGNNTGTWTYECPVLSWTTLGTKNIAFNDWTDFNNTVCGLLNKILQYELEEYDTIDKKLMVQIFYAAVDYNYNKYIRGPW